MNCYSSHDLHGKFEFIKWCVIYKPHKYRFYTGVSGIWTKDFYLSILKDKKKHLNRMITLMLSFYSLIILK